MSNLFAISSNNLIKIIIPFYISASLSSSSSSPLKSYNANTISLSSQMLAHNPSDLPAKTPPEFPPAQPQQQPSSPSIPLVPPEPPCTPNFPEFDPNPPHKRVNSPPVLPDPVPDFPGLPMPSPPGPDIPRPPMPSPPEPDIPLGPPGVFPPHAPDIIRLNPPEPGLPSPKSPGIEGPSGVVFESFVLKWWNDLHWT